MLRYANFAVHPKFPYVLVCVCEDHTHPEPAAVTTSLVTINTMTHTTEPLDAVAQLVSGADFYALCADALLKAMSRKAEELEATIGTQLSSSRSVLLLITGNSRQRN